MQTTAPERIADYVRRGWWGDTTLLDLFDDAVRRRPEQTALVGGKGAALRTIFEIAALRPAALEDESTRPNPTSTYESQH